MAQGVRLAQDAGMLGGQIVISKMDDYRQAQELVRMRDERREMNKLLRNDSRMRAKFDELENAITQMAEMRFPSRPREKVNETVSHELLVCLSDLHIGACYSNRFGVYNTKIAALRMSAYADRVIKLGQETGANRVTVVLLGDLISGNIHKEIAVTNRENVIQQVMTASEMVTRFIYTLSGVFDAVNVWSVAGNHSRIDRKEDALKDERLDDITTWYASAALRHIDNVRVHTVKENLDNTIAEFGCGAASVVAVHGDYDGENEAAVNKLKSFIGYEPEIIVTAHRHTGLCDVGETTVIRSGSLCGSGDPYTLSKRLKGRPMQSCVLIGGGEVKAIYPIYLETTDASEIETDW